MIYVNESFSCDKMTFSMTAIILPHVPAEDMLTPWHRLVFLPRKSKPIKRFTLNKHISVNHCVIQ